MGDGQFGGSDRYRNRLNYPLSFLTEGSAGVGERRAKSTNVDIIPRIDHQIHRVRSASATGVVPILTGPELCEGIATQVLGCCNRVCCVRGAHQQRRDAGRGWDVAIVEEAVGREVARGDIGKEAITGLRGSGLSEDREQDRNKKRRGTHCDDCFDGCLDGRFVDRYETDTLAESEEY